ncbi:methionine biosynthesis protein MetW [Herbaspirillum sp. BH-1]|jgi:methionine biosynthesis protein MetW|uniref:SAM-dependent methyltransferase n=2 Tax=Herbaspirillum frisingense TaxID=92645 RepID=A0AAI9IBJ7_9BURK|nr:MULTISPECIES: methionine biosynthesis protein MetW [Herbaspirillum]EOA02959.1 SAM-dependent methyltransferase [Herbaspirillum frisingense GSF30]MCI1016724.1 methionine biosynthesis protein MetW [Herbaspirillum sp. C7C2]MDR6586338.1 methionine biosynthesis protein MetW [Herbaspirillum frisingense]ONN68365.1 methionine biosynthesis protein MetW [Herbaspirillum sp. VT-16-41]PLY57713.1 methionine biosynthesis protein MetW [Herbaspirillum sp. BH-1]
MTFEQLSALRPDLAFIAHWVREKSQVLDLGCGDGVMLDYLQTDKGCSGYGVEIDDAQIPKCVARDVSVIQQDLNGGLAMFEDNAFDTVLCLSALQMVKDVEGTLREIARVGREVTVSFPNFAYWPHRVALLRGRMPVSRSLPYQWYDTPNLRCATIRDFEALANQVGLEVLECVALKDGKPVRYLPNWRGSLAVFRLRKK